MAALGANVLGIEGRAEWIRQANEKKRHAGLSNVDFVQDDVRNLSKEKYGEFDVVMCLGILYHIDAPDVFELVQQTADVCTGFSVIETHFATNEQAYRSQVWRGKQYLGASYLEHGPNATQAEKLSALGASLDNDLAFWFTQSSLYNILGHVGFTSVHEVRSPIPNLFVGPEKSVKVWGNRATLVAIKGKPISLSRSPEATAKPPIDWPENVEEYLLEDILTHARPLSPN